MSLGLPLARLVYHHGGMAADVQAGRGTHGAVCAWVVQLKPRPRGRGVGLSCFFAAGGPGKPGLVLGGVGPAHGLGWGVVHHQLVEATAAALAGVQGLVLMPAKVALWACPSCEPGLCITRNQAGGVVGIGAG